MFNISVFQPDCVTVLLPFRAQDELFEQMFAAVGQKDWFVARCAEGTVVISMVRDAAGNPDVTHPKTPMFAWNIHAPSQRIAGAFIDALAQEIVRIDHNAYSLTTQAVIAWQNSK